MPDSPGLFTSTPTVLTLSQTILATQSANLSAYWKCDETGGTTLADSSGVGQTLTITGTINTNYWLGEAGQNGTCFRNDGTVGFASRTNAAIINYAALDITIFALVKGGTDFGASGVTLSNSASASLNFLALGNLGATANARFVGRGNSSTEALITGGTAFDNTWHSILVRKIGTGFSLWVDGVSVGTQTQTLTAASAPNRTALLARVQTTTAIALGSIQHAAMWSNDLTDAEIAAIEAAR